MILHAEFVHVQASSVQANYPVLERVSAMHTGHLHRRGENG